MPDTGPVLCTTGEDNFVDSGFVWLNPERAATSGSSYSQSFALYDPSHSSRLECGGFSFDIPDDAVVVGFLIESSWNFPYLILTTTAKVKPADGDWSEGVAGNVPSFGSEAGMAGGATEDFGLSLTGADVKAPGFKVGLQATSQQFAHLEVNNVRLTVFYAEATPPPTTQRRHTGVLRDTLSQR